MKREYTNPEVEIITYSADTQIMVSAVTATPQTTDKFGTINYNQLT